MADNNLDAADLAAVARGGLIREEVMDQIWDISNVPLTFTDLAGTPDGAGNPYVSWVVDKLPDPDMNNAKVDGQDLTDNDEEPAGPREGNHHQISTKRLNVSQRANEVNTIGYARERVRQVSRGQIRLRRDVEGIMCGGQGSQADDGSSTPGLAAGLGAWIKTNVNHNGGTAPGFNPSTGLVPAYTPGTVRQGSLKAVKDVVEMIYIEGGDPTILMSTPGVIRGMSEYMFEDSAQIATLRGNTSADSGGQLTGKGSVNVFIADHGQVLEMRSNRVQRGYDATGAAATLFVLDPAYVRRSHLHGYRSEPQGKTGLSTKDQLSVDWSLKVLNELALGQITDLAASGTWSA